CPTMLPCTQLFSSAIFVYSTTTPLIPTLSYTTLFRSHECSPGNWIPGLQTLITHTLKKERAPTLKIDPVNKLEPGSKSSLNSLEDRKSTRLNSSHVSISYAVFCLKKKNQSTNTYQALR